MLSILIPVYNYNVLHLVKNLYDQAVKVGMPFEIIVLDDASTAIDTVHQNREITSFEFCTFLQNEINLGRTQTRQKLAKIAQFDTLLFLDADVMPASKDFLKNYLPYLTNETSVVLGGIAYRVSENTQGNGLRYNYGIKREQKTAEERSKNPYGNVLSGNMLIKKDIFLSNNYDDIHNYYGMDILMAYNLYKNGVPVKHINNPVYHLGLEDNPQFFEKSLKAVESRKILLSKAPGVEDINSLLRHYKLLKRWRLVDFIKIFFRIFERPLRKRIVCDEPNLFIFDLYRLGYLCSLD